VRILVTGASGFLGRHVVQALTHADPDVEVIGLGRHESEPHPGIERTVRADLAEASELRAALAGWSFDACVHLAGIAAGASVSALYRTNVQGTANLMDAIGAGDRVRRIVLASSCAVYGAGGDVHERTPVAPLTAYGKTCALREMVTSLLAAGESELAILRLFNLVGPGQPDTMMIPTVARQLARIERGLQPPKIAVGRLDTCRDYVDVRDAAAAIASVTLGDGPVPELLNLGLGSCISGSEILNLLIDLADTRPEIVVVEHPARAGDVPRIQNVSDLARSRIPWNPRYTLRESLRDTLDDWRVRAVR
jgi:GDP-4-dehydro-6-deoxy-D-mannose reductase